MLLDRCPWYIAGPMLGLLIVALRAAVNKPAMVGEGQLAGLPVMAGLFTGVALQGLLVRRTNVTTHMPVPATAGLEEAG